MAWKKHLSFVVFLLIAVSLMTFQSRVRPISPFGFLRDAETRLSDFTGSVFDSLGGFAQRAAYKNAQINTLRKKNAFLMLDLMEAEELRRENMRLRALLSLKDALPEYVQSARVIGKGGGRWSQSFVIDKGRRDGVRKDMAVITPEGLLGKVSEALENYSTVLLINDPKFSVAVRLEESRLDAVLSGTGKKTMRLKYVPSEEEVSEGEGVFTSGLDFVFPPGIRAGKVLRVLKPDNELFQRIGVAPAVEARKVEEVIVVSPPKDRPKAGGMPSAGEGRP